MLGRSIALSLFAASSLFAQYPPGHVWNHLADYQDGTVPGSTTGNPNLDFAGNPAWEQVSYSAGGSRNSATPWFETTPSLLVWDDDFLGFGDVWVRSDDVDPILGGDYLQHTYHVTNAYTPGARWTNPTGRTLTVDANGHVVLTWNNWAGGDPSMDIDVVFVHEDVSAGAFVALTSTTVSKPVSSAELIVPLGDHTVVAEPGDRITFTFRALGVANASQVFANLEYVLRIDCDPGDDGCVSQRPAMDAGTGILGTQPSTTVAGQNTRAADRFTVGTSRLLRAVTWYGGSLDDAGPSMCSKAHEFSLTVYEDAGGQPGVAVVGPLTISAGPTLEQQLTELDAFRSGEKIDVLRFRHELDQPVVLASGPHWLELVDTAAGTCYWSWLESDEGDGTALVDVGMDGYSPLDTTPFDLAFCLELDAGLDLVAGGCAGEARPRVDAPPSATTSYTVTCPTPSVPCLSGAVVVFGSCAVAPLTVPPPIGCGTCSLVVDPSFGSADSPMTIAPGLPIGFEFCVQCGCVAAPPSEPLCIVLSPGLELTVGP